MKLGDIKIEALRLMNVGADRDLAAANMEVLEMEEGIRDYMQAMPASLMRCLSDIEEKMILPPVTETLCGGELVGRYLRFSLADIPQLYHVMRVSCVYDGEYISNVPYERDGDELLLVPLPDGYYRITYRPCAPVVTPYTSNETELAIPDKIAAWIPYFIKSELYAAEEADEAAAARNLYEQQMAQVAEAETRRCGVQKTVKTVFDFREV